LQLGRATEALAAFEAAAPLTLPLSPADGGEGTGEGKQHDGAEVDALLGRALALEALHRDGEALVSLREFLRRAPNHLAAAEARARLARLSAKRP